MMDALTSNFLLAQFSRWERLGDGFRRSGRPLEFSDLVPYIVALLVLGGITAAFVTYRRRNDLGRPCTDSQKLFRELCLAHDLDRSAQKLLGQLAEAFHLAQPSEVFVRPRVFSPEQLPEHLQDEAARIAELRQRLF
ncbi:hypothetical protein [Bythopirellula polymerisocia]|uniref:Uncharacterized protein n=1 Tax=Bythopirellula polymerisocia TaxID=2528003 RepID=A0A5C6CV52_9BACT|nr:hypothetical protein [Bythopirellula polymerisocia]TWU27321.1 hypothetical protein Pla144_20930 [Bythopirellula polymerisocia]